MPASYSLIQTQVGEHRRDDRPDADIAVTFRHRGHSLGRGFRELKIEVVTCGAAFQEHLRGVQLRRQFFVFHLALAANPRPGVQQQLQSPSVAPPLAKRAVSVGVGVNQAGDEQFSAGVDVRGLPGKDFTRGTQGGDFVFAHHDILMRGHAGLDIQHPPAANHRAVIATHPLTQTARMLRGATTTAAPRCVHRSAAPCRRPLFGPRDNRIERSARCRCRCRCANRRPV